MPDMWQMTSHHGDMQNPQPTANIFKRTDKPEGQFYHTEWPEVIG